MGSVVWPSISHERVLGISTWQQAKPLLPVRHAAAAARERSSLAFLQRLSFSQLLRASCLQASASLVSCKHHADPFPLLPLVFSSLCSAVLASECSKIILWSTYCTTAAWELDLLHLPPQKTLQTRKEETYQPESLWKKHSNLLSVASHPWTSSFSQGGKDKAFEHREGLLPACALSALQAVPQTIQYEKWPRPVSFRECTQHYGCSLPTASAQNASWHRILLDKVRTWQGFRALLQQWHVSTCDISASGCYLHGDLQTWNGPRAWQWAVTWRFPLALYSECTSARLFVISSCSPGPHSDYQQMFRHFTKTTHQWQIGRN